MIPRLASLPLFVRMLLLSPFPILLLALDADPADAQLSPVVITGPAGSGLFGRNVRGLPNGNFVVSDPGYDAGAVLDVGAVHLYDGNTLTRIATLTGSTAADQVGLDGADPGVIVLPNGNYLVRTQNWDNGALVNVGALTYCNSVTGCDGVVSAANSLVGTTANDFVGISVKVLSTGHYVSIQQVWDNPLGGIVNTGAVTFCSGSSGCTGPVSGSNSLIGARTEDRVGAFLPLSNGNYVVATRNWDNPSPSLRTDAGAVSWCSGTSGCQGPVSSGNSLIGSTANDRVGDLVAALGDGSYVVGSGGWDKPSPALVDAGAATWCSSSGSCNGLVVTAASSLTGATANDQVGGGLNAFPLPNGAYAMSTQSFDVPLGATDVGAVTWCAAGGIGCTGTVVSPANSLVGARLGDLFGPQIVPLKNGNLAIGSVQWDDPATLAGNVGAVAFCPAATHCAGQVLGPSNALVGSTAVDNVGSSIVALANGNYVVRSPAWDNGATTDVGAVTFCDGSVGCVGVVGVGNSYTGVAASDQVGSGGVLALANGHYVVGAPSWNSGTTLDVGAVRFCDGNVGCFGTPGIGNALVGSITSDLVGSGGLFALPNGSYVVSSRIWDNGAVVNAGASTWCSGTSGCTGVISPGNSLVGSTNGDQISNPGVDALAGDKYLVRSAFFDNGAVVNGGAFTLGSALGGTFGVVGSANSIVGTATDGISAYDYDAARDRLYVGRAASNDVAILAVPEPGMGAIWGGALALFGAARRRARLSAPA